MAANTNNRRIQVGDLDFDGIKNNIKSYLRGQEEFSDYDFEGSAMSTLIDVLAYNTHYNSLYTNLAVNESFLDSASKRASVVSLAKMLGYTPRSARSARATVTVTLSNVPGGETIATLPKNQVFSTQKDGKTFNFYNKDQSTVAVNSAGNFVFPNIEIIEGVQVTHRYTQGKGQRFLIQNENADLSTLSVKIQPNSSNDSSEVYTRSDDIVSAASDTKVYFIKEIEGVLYEITFGDGIIGKALDEGNYITIDYHVSSLAEPNLTRNFTYNGIDLHGGQVTVNTTSIAADGAPREDIDSIKFNAPRMYAAQNRAVTPDDYKSLIYALYPTAGSVTVWGGEDNDPPVYGKTFICIKPVDAIKLTQKQKDFVKANILKQRNIVSITPELVDPEYFNIKVTCFAYYNPRLTDKTPLEIADIVKQAIFNYDTNQLQRFEGVLRYSQLVRLIDEAHPSITNNITRIMVRREFRPVYNQSTEYKLVLINPISQDGGKQGDVFSTTGFYIPNSNRVHFLDDDAIGNIRLYYIGEDQTKVIVNPAIGDIDYENGNVTVRNLTVTKLDGPIFEFQVKPESYDVVSALNQITQISRELIDVRAIPDATANGDLQGGYNYDFQSVRS